MREKIFAKLDFISFFIPLDVSFQITIKDEFAFCTVLLLTFVNIGNSGKLIANLQFPMFGN